MSAKKLQTFQTTPFELLNLYFGGAIVDENAKGELYAFWDQFLSWELLADCGYQIDLAPLLLHIIKNANAQSGNIRIREKTKAKLKSIANHYYPRCMLQFETLDRLFAQFEKDEIDAIPLKGAHLARYYYANEFARPMGDLDILVKIKDVERAKNCLLSLGFSIYRPKKKVDHLEDHPFHIQLVKKELNMTLLVELHSHIALNSMFNSIRIEDFWKHAAPINGRYTHIRFPAKEYLLLHLLWHTYLNISKSADIHLLWLIDIALVLQDKTRQLDWALVEKLVVETGISKRAYFCLLLVKELFHLDIDKAFLQANKAGPYETKIFFYIMKQVDKPRSKLTQIFYIILLKFFSIQTPHHRLLYLTRLLFHGIF